MKYIPFLFFFFSEKSALSQTGTNVSDSAEMYLSGVIVPYNPVKSYALFTNRALNGEAKAMNALGMMHSKGIGVDSSFANALYWFRQAAVNGYAKSWVNIGMLYKRKSVDSAGYAIAHLYFDTALIHNEPSAFFAKGYMLYKGLGCNQDYPLALLHFRQGNTLGRADCLYFTGLCFKYGYGVVADTDSATFYIQSAARLGYKPANTERYLNLNGAGTGYASKSAGTGYEVVVKKHAVKQNNKPYDSVPFSTKYIQISGTYTGVAVQYDYSGKIILGETPVELQVISSGIGLYGVWKQEGQEPVSLVATQSGNYFTFTSTSQISASLKSSKRKFPLIFRSIQLNEETIGDTVYLTGALFLFNTYTKEPEKPVNIRLSGKVNRVSPSVLKSGLMLYPNPAASEGVFTVSFNLVADGHVMLNIFDVNGHKIFTQSSPFMRSGKQTLKVKNARLLPGYYILNIRSGRQQESIAFISK
ncbi:MAG TPA: T9SS type A sorting domain-containing protein [Ferruginibacter sp.]|nr:T9SS type A sorting domain-containing protein [Ferruginibacter sp.]